MCFSRVISLRAYQLKSKSPSYEARAAPTASCTQFSRLCWVSNRYCFGILSGPTSVSIKPVGPTVDSRHRRRVTAQGSKPALLKVFWLGCEVAGNHPDRPLLFRRRSHQVGSSDLNLCSCQQTRCWACQPSFPSLPQEWPADILHLSRMGDTSSICMIAGQYSMYVKLRTTCSCMYHSWPAISWWLSFISSAADAMTLAGHLASRQQRQPELNSSLIGLSSGSAVPSQ